MSEALHDKILAYLKSHQSMVFAATADGEQIGSTTCYVADDDLTIYGFVFKGSDKFQAVEASAPITLAIDEGFTIPMHGIEFHGRGEFIDGDADTQRAQELLQNTFPKLANVWGHPAVVLIRIRPERITLIDWTVRLGHSDTLTLENTAA